MTEHDVTTADGRTLRVRETGAPGGPVLLAHHGSPGSGIFHGAEAASAERLGVRLIGYDRPGYGGSTARRDRTVADAVADVEAILDALGAERFGTYGWSGGGPHALACAALLPDRCTGAATVAGVGPSDAPDLDWLAGMGEGNHAEFGAARQGREALIALCEAERTGLIAAEPSQLADAMRPHLSDVDAEALTGDLAAFVHESITTGLRPGVDGWVDDDYAFLAPWGFDVGSLRVPVLIWQGEEDLMVPADHARWLRRHVAGAEGGLVAGEGHITLFGARIGEVHQWLLGAAGT